MDSHWQNQLLALVTRYGEQCSQMATERARGIHEHPPADRAGAWAAILAHLAHPSVRAAGTEVRTETA